MIAKAYTNISPWWPVNLFDRVVELRVGETEITGLDVAFEIEKDLKPEPNPCHIEIFNMGAENRAIISKYKQVPVLLKAGYKGNVGVIFHGDMIRCSHIKEGPTWRTVLANGDGAKAIQSERINKSFSKGTPVKTVIKEIAKQLKIPSGGALEQLEALSQKLTRGFMVSGNAMDELGKILRHYGYSASVQNNSLQVLKGSEALSNQVINLTSSSGLKGSPEVGSNKKLKIHAVLMPELLPGQKVHIESFAFKSFATIQQVRFIGGTCGGEWESEMECFSF